MRDWVSNYDELFLNNVCRLEFFYRQQDLGEGEEVDLKSFVDFQFPPRVKSDNRSLSWNIDPQKGDGDDNLNNAATGLDPIATTAGNSPRDMTLEWDYIVEDVTNNLKWNILYIKEQINLVRGVFTGFRTDVAGNARKGTMLCGFRYPWITGTRSLSFRINNIALSYDGPLIGGTVGNPYPLKTTITIDMSSMTLPIAEGNIVGATTPPTFDELWY